MVSSLFDLSGKVAVITGSSRGIGYASALGMAEHGAKVVISGRKAEAVAESAAEINRHVGAEVALAVACNIGRKNELQNLVDITSNMAMEFASKGVCANCIAPGTFKTGMARSQWEDASMLAWYNSRNPSKRFGEVEEIAGVAVMLASPAGGYINGQTIAVDGGHTISFR